MSSSQPFIKHVLDLPRNHYPVKILQFGSGNFIRGFADWMIQEANRRVGFDAGVAVVQSVSNSTTLQDQEGVFTVILKGIRDEEFVSEYFTIDTIQRVVYPSVNFNSFLEEGLNPDLQIILSNTSETGIQFVDTDNSIGQLATSFPGKLTQLLYHRFKNGFNNSLIILPTELIERNGTVLKAMVLQYSKLWSLPPEFITWVNSNITFCNTLVDRIVSGFPKRNKQLVFEKIGYQDELAVEAEWFHLWVIEGPRWINEVLPFRKAGFNVIITNDLAPYRFRKVRILNGAHTSMAVIGYACGLQTVKDALDHPHLGKFMRRMIYDEIVPQIPGDILELEKYTDEVISRLRNPAIEHKLEHIAHNSFSKFKVRVLPSIIDNIERNGHVPERLSFTFAALLYFYRGHGEGRQFKLHDSEDVLNLMSNAWNSVPLSEEGMERLAHAILGDPYWGAPLEKYPLLIKRISKHLYYIVSNGLMESSKAIEIKN